MSTTTATLKDGRTVDYLPGVIGEGGMKRVYFTADKQSVLCFFKDQREAKDPNRMARLDAILGKYNPTLDARSGQYWSTLFLWPTAIVVSPSLGVMTPVYPGNFFFASGNWAKKEKKGKWFSSPKLRKLLPAQERGNWLNYLQLCILKARAVRKLHMMGLAHSDLSCNNVLIDPPGGKCAVIDIDSLVVPGVFPPDVLGTAGYIAPEVLATQNLELDDARRRLPTTLTDLHALPVLIYEYLLRRHPLRGPRVNALVAEQDEALSMGEKALFIEHPTDNSNRPKTLSVTYDQLGVYLKGLMARAFVDGLHNPSARPSAPEWERALCRTSDLLIQCGNSACEENWFVYKEGEASICPWCGWRLKTPTPVFDFYVASRAGNFLPEKHCLVAWNHRRLHEWHVFKNRVPGEFADSSVYARVTFHQGQWIMVNEKLNSMVSPRGNPVPIGQACPLKPGDQILLSKDEHGRMIVVRMIP